MTGRKPQFQTWDEFRKRDRYTFRKQGYRVRGTPTNAAVSVGAILARPGPWHPTRELPTWGCPSVTGSRPSVAVQPHDFSRGRSQYAHTDRYRLFPVNADPGVGSHRYIATTVRISPSTVGGHVRYARAISPTNVRTRRAYLLSQAPLFCSIENEVRRQD